MSIECGSQFISKKDWLAQRLFESENARTRVISMHEACCRQTPPKADIALVLGTSYILYKDKFLKRIYTATQLQLDGKVRKIIFSGSSDSESENENQSQQALEFATNNFGLMAKDALIVGGKNTKENVEEARKLLTTTENTRSVFLVSDNKHLIRALPLARRMLDKIGVDVYPFPVPGSERLNPNDPDVVLEIIKTFLYNSPLNRDNGESDEVSRTRNDRIINYYTSLIRGIPSVPEISFETWRESNFNK